MMRSSVLFLTLSVLCAGAAGVSATAQTQPMPPPAGGQAGPAKPDEPQGGASSDTMPAPKDGGGAALTAGGSTSTGPRPETLTDALKKCDKLTGSAAAKCQEDALAAHPGEW